MAPDGLQIAAVGNCPDLDAAEDMDRLAALLGGDGRWALGRPGG